MSDFTIHDHGSIMLLQPLTEAGQEWANEHLPDDVMTFGTGIVVEPRYMARIVEGIVNDGLEISIR